MIALVEGLPAQTSAIYRHLIGDAWTTETELVAQAVDLLGILASNHQLKTAPKPLPRPAGLTPKKEAEVVTISDAASFFTGRPA